MLLAKSKPKRLLLHHTLDVFRFAKSYAERWPHLATDEHFFDDLLLGALLHDLGKAASGFQNLLEGKEDGSWNGYRHEILSAALVTALPYSERRQDLLLAIMTHHMGLNDDLNSRRSLASYDPKDDPHTPFQIRLAQLSAHWSSLGQLYGDLTSYLGHDLWFALPETPQHLADPFKALRENQLRRRRSRQPSTATLALRKIFMRGLLIAADHLASAAITDANADQEVILPEMPTLRQINPSDLGFTLNAHQYECAETTGSVFLNAPTGSGKTEAALLWTQANQSPQNTRHIFYVLPFTASINAMYHRLKDKHFGEGAVSLLHGRSAYFAYKWLCEAEPDTETKEVARQVKVARQQTKELYYPVKVLTPHQVLMAFLGVKGWEKSFCEYAGGLFIFDEIHAYDPHLTGLLFEMLKRLTQELEAEVCIMSATFPTLLKGALEEHIGPFTEIATRERERYSRHIVAVREGSLEGCLEEIRTKLAAGLKVLVVLNTVKAAMTCFEQLRASAKNPCLIHGRLIQRDRQAAESALAKKDVDLLIGTQAIEVSLDIDFDVLYSDPAPLDALLQRFGRVNRKSLQELEQLPEDVRYRNVVVFKEQLDTDARIYDRSDAGKRLVKRTLATLSDGLLEESAVQGLIDTIFDEEQLRSFLETARERTEKLKNFMDTIEPGSEKPFGEDDVLSDLIDSLPIVPVRFQGEHQRLLEERRFFDAQDFEFSISWGRYHALRNKGQLAPQTINKQTVYYGEFAYEEGIGPDFDVVMRMETIIW